MRRLVLLSLVLSLAWAPVVAQAQPPQGQDEEEPTPEELEDEEDEEDIDEEEPAGEGDQPRLRPPSVEPIDVEERERDVDESIQQSATEQTEAEEDDFPTSPAMGADELEGSAPPSSDPTEMRWTAPQPVLTVHGYFRTRSELWDTFWLGRTNRDFTGDTDPPFDRFIPVDHSRGGAPHGGCGDEGVTSSDDERACETETIGFANMRLRLQPTLSLSDDVRVHMMVDALDNVVLGSTPDGLVTVPASGGGFERVERTPRVPLDTFAATSVPPSTYRNSLQDSIVVRRAWGEVTNRGLGQLRFGRMGSHWGLGLLANGGEGIDADFQSDVDRIMGITKIAGFYLAAAWDFANEGYINQNLRDPLALTYDAAQDDDVDQYVFAAARRMDEEEQRAALQRGEAVLNGGAYFVYRKQLLSGVGVRDIYAASPPPITEFVRRDAEAFIPDIWVQFLYGGLRLEAEAVLIAGSIENTNTDRFLLEEFNILQFGAALEAEYRLLDDKLGIYFYTGLASGDEDVEGLAVAAGLPAQLGGDDTISTFRFHPNYRIDLILWRNIMQQVAGAYYFKPGLSYDFIRNSFGQLFGLRADVVWSRAVAPVQTWGNDPDLGVEINARLYYRSEDGPELVDGFYGSLEYGILFPLGGLGYLTRENGTDDRGLTPPDLENAQILRLILGVQY